MNLKQIKDGSASPFSRIFGILKGTVTITPGVDLTKPTGEKWNAEQYDDAPDDYPFTRLAS